MMPELGWTDRSWVRPTLRSMSWSPVIVVVVGSAVTTAAFGALDRDLPKELARAMYGAIAAAATLSLHDRAHSLTQPTATGPRIRLLHRVALLTPTVWASVTILGAIGRWHSSISHETESTMPSVAAIAALWATGAAVMVWMMHSRSEHAADMGAAISSGWVVVGVTMPASMATNWMMNAWIEHPPIVITAAVGLVIVGTSRAWA